MTTTQPILHKVERREIQSAREALLLKLLSPDTDVKIRQRQFVKELMAEIKALRTLGVGFDEIAETLKEFGCRLSSETLRTYYYEEKREQDEESLHAVAERYKEAAESALTDYHMKFGRNLESLVKRAVEDAAAKKLNGTSSSPAPVPEPIVEPPAAAVADSDRRVSEGVDDVSKTDKNEVAGLLNKHVAKPDSPAPPKISSNATKPSPSPQQVASILTSSVDITNIPDRDG